MKQRSPKKDKNNLAVVIQARMGSTRFPGKVVSDLQGMQLIKVIIKRLRQSSQLNNIIFATTDNKEDDILCSIAKDLKIKFVRGETKDVLSRFVSYI